MPAQPLCLPRTQEQWDAMQHLIRARIIATLGEIIEAFIQDDPNDDSRASFQIRFVSFRDGQSRTLLGHLNAQWAEIPFGNPHEQPTTHHTYVLFTILNANTLGIPAQVSQWRIFI